MLGANTMPRADDAALQQRECGLDGVRVDVSVHIDSVLVFDGLVLRGQSVLFHCAGVRSVFLRDHDLNILTHVFSDVLGQRPRPCIGSMEKTEIATTLPDANDNFFRGDASRLASARRSAANLGFVNFDSTVHHGPVYLT